MRISWVGGMLGAFAVIAIGASRAGAAYCLDTSNDVSPRIVSYGDVAEFVRYGRPALPAAAPAMQPSAPLAPPTPDASLVPHLGPLGYSVIDVSEEAILSGVRLIMRVQLSRAADESELRHIGDEMIRRESARRRLSAIAFVYYLADARAADACAFGTAVWAPSGNWSATHTVRLGDYTDHQHVVAGAPFRRHERPASVVRTIAVATRARQPRAANTTP